MCSVTALRKRTTEGLLVARGMTLNEMTGRADRPSDDTREEADLARAAAAGDRRAFAELYRRHLDAVYRYCFFRLRSESEAEDVTADVFHRALVAMPRYEARRPFLAFLYTIARNMMVDRARRARPEATFEDALEHPTDEAGPEARSVAAAEATHIREAIRQLSPLQQEVVILRFIDGRDTKEIARMLGRRESTVRGIQMRALAARRLLVDPEP